MILCGAFPILALNYIENVVSSYKVCLKFFKALRLRVTYFDVGSIDAANILKIEELRTPNVKFDVLCVLPDVLNNLARKSIPKRILL
jgi:hypothetical protein